MMTRENWLIMVDEVARSTGYSCRIFPVAWQPSNLLCAGAHEAMCCPANVGTWCVHFKEECAQSRETILPVIRERRTMALDEIIAWATEEKRKLGVKWLQGA